MCLIAADGIHSRAIDLEVSPSPRASNQNLRLLVLSKLQGLCTDAEIVEVVALTESNEDGFEAVPVAFGAFPVATGVQELEVVLPKNLNSVKTILIKVEHLADDGGLLHGSTIATDWPSGGAVSKPGIAGKGGRSAVHPGTARPLEMLSDLALGSFFRLWLSGSLLCWL